MRVELKTSRLLNGCSNQLSYESICSPIHRYFISMLPLVTTLALPCAGSKRISIVRLLLTNHGRAAGRRFRTKPPHFARSLTRSCRDLLKRRVLESSWPPALFLASQPYRSGKFFFLASEVILKTVTLCLNDKLHSQIHTARQNRSEKGPSSS